MFFDPEINSGQVFANLKVIEAENKFANFLTKIVAKPIVLLIF